MEPVEIPEFVDAPPNLLFWQADEVAPIFFGLFVGMIVEQAAICTFIGFMLVRVYRKFRDSRPEGFLVHLLYWWTGFSGAKDSVTFPNPFIRMFKP